MFCLFDLDGTLTDPYQGIAEGLAVALAAVGLPGPEPEQVGACIGPPLREGLRGLGVPADRVEEALAAYRRYYDAEGLLRNRVFDGVPEMLAELHAQGWGIGLATYKPQPIARRILEHFGLAEWFAAVCGAEAPTDSKADVIARAVTVLGLPAQASGAMVGDRHHDVLGALQTGLAPVGVTWGYGSVDELRSAGAAAVVGHPSALPEAVTGVCGAARTL